MHGTVGTQTSKASTLQGAGTACARGFLPSCGQGGLESGAVSLGVPVREGSLSGMELKAAHSLTRRGKGSKGGEGRTTGAHAHCGSLGSLHQPACAV